MHGEQHFPALSQPPCLVYDFTGDLMTVNDMGGGVLGLVSVRIFFSAG